MKFKVGDKVRVRNWDDMAKDFGIDNDGDIDIRPSFLKSMRQYCGNELEIIEIHSDYYELSGIDNWVFTDRMISSIKFSERDMKDGYMCKTRAGKIFMWINGLPQEFDYVIGCTLDNLKNSSTDECDIIEVRDSSSIINGGIKDLFRNYDKMPVIWKEEPVKKDVSLEELNAILKEKFPDVDEFNLPIKE